MAKPEQDRVGVGLALEAVGPVEVTFHPHSQWTPARGSAGLEADARRPGREVELPGLLGVGGVLERLDRNDAPPVIVLDVADAAAHVVRPVNLDEPVEREGGIGSRERERSGCVLREGGDGQGERGRGRERGEQLQVSGHGSLVKRCVTHRQGESVAWIRAVFHERVTIGTDPPRGIVSLSGRAPFMDGAQAGWLPARPPGVATGAAPDPARGRRAIRHVCTGGQSSVVAALNASLFLGIVAPSCRRRSCWWTTTRNSSRSWRG